MSCYGQAQPLGTKDNIYPLHMQYDTLPPNEFRIDIHENHFFYCIIAPIDDLFDYRRPDYNDGFYIFYQVATLSDKEVRKKTPIDKAKQPPKNFIAHYASDGHYDTGGGLGFQIPYYQVTYVEVPIDYDFNTFDAAHYDGQWKPHDWNCPDYMLLRSTLNVYANEKREAAGYLEAHNQVLLAEQDEVLYAAFRERLDLNVIEQLKANKQYDTIIKTDSSTLYLNTDLESVEYPSAPDVFHVIRRTFYPNGSLKERQKFLPGVYTSFSLPIGLSGAYDESGQLEMPNMDGITIFPFPQMANVEFCVRLLEREGYIDRKTGTGKATITINQHVNPHEPNHGETRLSIRSPWNIQADDTPNSTVGLLIQHDDIETVYIIDKNSRNILKTFNR